jgi:hypothetical protein
MKVSYAVLADGANVSLEGKPNILGVLDTINSPVFPCNYPALSLVFGVELGAAERVDTKALEVIIIDDDGKDIAHLNGQFPPRDENQRHRTTTHLVVNFAGLLIPHPGSYSVNILVAGEEKATLPLTINQLRPDGQRRAG